MLYLLTDLLTAHYDSMLVKCTCHGSTYEIARRKMLRALVEFRIRGVKTNIPFLASLLTHPTFVEGNCWTTFIDDTPELFDLVGSQNRGQKLLAYLGDLAVNGSSIKGQIGEPKFKGDIIMPELFDASGAKIDTSLPAAKGWRNILLEQGPEAFAAAVRKNKGCLLMDTTWRDAHQSLLATRVRTVDLLNIAKETSHAYSNLYSLECWGGATFDVAMRFLYEDPWDRLRKMRKLIPNIPFQMLLRGANGVAYSSLPDNAIFHFCEQAKKHGVDIFRVFDALNDIDQLEVGIKAVHKAGGVVEGTVCISGDMLVRSPLLFRIFICSFAPSSIRVFFALSFLPFVRPPVYSCSLRTFVPAFCTPSSVNRRLPFPTKDLDEEGSECYNSLLAVMELLLTSSDLHLTSPDWSTRFTTCTTLPICISRASIRESTPSIYTFESVYRGP